MKKIILAAAVLLPVAAVAATLESLSANAGRDFLAAPVSVRPSVQALAQRQAADAPAPVLLTPVVRVLGAGEKLGLELGRVNLAAQLDKNLYLLNEVLGSRRLDVGIATDPG